MKRILITGGLGFLGSYCVEKYKNEGYDITIIDNLSSNVIGPDDDICNGCKVIINDIIEHNWDDDVNQYDVILHLASPVGPVGILKHSGKMANIILKDIYSVINGSTKNNCPLVFISTSEIYGHRSEATLLKESDDKVLVGDFSVRNEYSIAKLLCEIVLDNTAKISNLKYQIIRPFNISGARQMKNGGFVLPTFVTQSLNNEDITVFYTGEQVRAFTHVKDIVDGIFLVSTTKKFNQIWNIGNSENVSTINYLAETVKEKVKTDSKIIRINPKQIHGNLYEEAWDKIPNSTKIQQELGWSPKFTKDEIIEDVINFYKKNN
jgi:nucleoside-diphosphate-sugar epimerase